MTILRKNIVFIKSLSAILVPFLSLYSPTWLSINGIGPSWAILWLLPWSLEYGPIKGVIAASFLGLSLDSISIGNFTQIPALLILSFFWGRIGRKGITEISGFGFGVLACTGTSLIGISFWLQLFTIQSNQYLDIFNTWSIHSTICQMIITGLISPIICSSLLLFFKSRKFSKYF